MKNCNGCFPICDGLLVWYEIFGFYNPVSVCNNSGKFAGTTEKVKGFLLCQRFHFLASLT